MVIQLSTMPNHACYEVYYEDLTSTSQVHCKSSTQSSLHECGIAHASIRSHDLLSVPYLTYKAPSQNLAYAHQQVSEKLGESFW